MSNQDHPVDRETLVEEFGEEHVEHTEWWAEEMGRVNSVREEILETVQNRDDVQLMKAGTSTSSDGRHEATFKIRVAGEPWDGGDDNAE